VTVIHFCPAVSGGNPLIVVKLHDFET